MSSAITPFIAAGNNALISAALKLFIESREKAKIALIVHFMTVPPSDKRQQETVHSFANPIKFRLGSDSDFGRRPDDVRLVRITDSSRTSRRVRKVPEADLLTLRSAPRQ